MDNKIIEGLDVLDIVSIIDKKSRAYQAIILQEVEGVIPKNSPEFSKVRKIVLDNMNEYTRSMLRAVFGVDFEGKID
jgi:hypothetical protein